MNGEHADALLVIEEGLHAHRLVSHATIAGGWIRSRIGGIVVGIPALHRRNAQTAHRPSQLEHAVKDRMLHRQFGPSPAGQHAVYLGPKTLPVQRTPKKIVHEQHTAIREILAQCVDLGGTQREALDVLPVDER